MFQTTLIFGGTLNNRKTILDEYIHAETVPPQYLLKVASDDLTQSVKIQDIRIVQGQIALKPSIGNTILIVIEELERATIETQNALLKLLEEPPPYVRIVATVDSKEKLLSTIVSRCRLVKADHEITVVSVTPELIENVISLFTSSTGRRFELAAEVAQDTSTTRAWIKEKITQCRALLLAHYHAVPYKAADDSFHFMQSSQLILAIQTLSRALVTLEQTNTNTRLLFENLLLQLPYISRQNA